MKQPRKLTLEEKKILSQYADKLTGWRTQGKDKETIYFVNIQTGKRMKIRY